jgi:hypothetical protein
MQQLHTDACPGVAHFLLAEFLLGKILGIERRKTCTSHLIVEPLPMATQESVSLLPHSTHFAQPVRLPGKAKPSRAADVFRQVE